MHILEYITKAMNSRYWHTRVQFYVEFNGNVLNALREQGWNGKYMSAGDMSRCLTQETKNLYSKIAIGTYKDGRQNYGLGSTQFCRQMVKQC